MKNKGFTLVELLATIIILGIIGLIAFPTVNKIIKNNKEELYKSQIKKIESLASDWAYSNRDLLPDEGNSITITILELKKAGLLPLDVKDPRDNKLFPNDMQVIITSINNNYTYKVDLESGTDITAEFNENSPILILNGNALEYIEIGSDYIDLGAQAKSKTGNQISDIVVMNQYNGSEISSINTNEFKTYTIVYSASDSVNGKTYTSSVTRTVVVRDTTAPDLIIPSKVDVSIENIASFDLLQGVTVTDNSGEVITVTTSGYEQSLGKKIVTYSACDSHNNCVSKKRIINIVS